MKVVLDTNIFLSGWLWGGTPELVLKLRENHLIEICASDILLNELQATLNRNKFRSKLQALGVTVNDLMSGIRELAEIYPISPLDFPELRDAKDSMILATEIAAETIVTGDLDLLVLQEYQRVVIVTARDFLDRYFPES